MKVKAGRDILDLFNLVTFDLIIIFVLFLITYVLHNLLANI